MYLKFPYDVEVGLVPEFNQVEPHVNRIADNVVFTLIIGQEGGLYVDIFQ